MARGVPNAKPDPDPTPRATLAPGRLDITGIEQLLHLAQILYRGGAAALPNLDKPERVFTVILHGLEVGLAPTQALAGIMMQPNGRCSIWGDAAIALVRASGLLAKHEPETVGGEGDDRTGTCVIQRVGEPERTFTFSMREAKQAGLIDRARGKDGKGTGPWISYPDRMLKMRARGFAVRDVFPDVMKGLITTEEAQDFAAAEVGAPRVVAVESASSSPAAGITHVESDGAGPGVLVGDAPVPKALPESPPPLAAAVAEPADGPLTNDQLDEIAWIRRSVVAAKGLTDPAQQAEAWKEVLGGYGVASARQFTRATAAAFLERERPKHDPFTHPPESRAT